MSDLLQENGRAESPSGALTDADEIQSLMRNVSKSLGVPMGMLSYNTDLPPSKPVITVRTNGERIAYRSR